ncbi:MAG: MmcQ/YjbR family DNA-binding protein [Granulicella sp.]
MNAESMRAFLLKRPHVVETMQWAGKLAFWVGDKAIGGKMFAVMNLDGDGKAVLSYSAGAERYAELLEVEGMFPAPYMARIWWIAAERWDVFRPRQWEQELQNAYDLTLRKLAPGATKALQLPPKELRLHVVERRRLLEARAAAKQSAKPALGSRRKDRETSAGTQK